ncbi:hypothetical protein NPIL_599911 [Nephila pilipes]|uniref:Uncharacterized protein n=1 Tax=Nephila pilipes TaxID=299642 RepID=A0A8X6TCK5_NEPPI|nr:hypothetical protein NPIL_599911 [Nephila pilipes]
MPPLPSVAVWLTVIENMRDSFPHVATLTALGITFAETHCSVQLQASQAGAMNKIPITKTSKISRLEKMVGCRVLGEHLHGLPLVNQTRQLSDVMALQIISEEPGNQACSGRNHAVSE